MKPKIQNCRWRQAEASDDRVTEVDFTKPTEGEEMNCNTEREDEIRTDLEMDTNAFNND